MALEEPGRLVLSGGSYSEDGVHEFAKHLAAVPGLANVARFYVDRAEYQVEERRLNLEPKKP